MTEEDAQLYLSIGITPVEVVKLRWPGVDVIRAEHILWELTSFPMVQGILDLVEAVASVDERKLQ